MKQLPKQSKLYRTLKYATRHRNVKLDNYQKTQPAVRNWRKYLLEPVE